MQKMKRLMAMLLCLCMVVSMLPAAAFAEELPEEEENAVVLQAEEPAEEVTEPEETAEEPVPEEEEPVIPEQEEQPEEAESEETSKEAAPEEEVSVPAEPEALEKLPAQQVISAEESETEEEKHQPVSPYGGWTDEQILEEYIRLMEADAGDALDEFVGALSEAQQLALWEALSAMVDDTPAAQGILHSGTCGENLTWKLDDEGTLTISGTGAMEDYDIGGPWQSYRNQISRVVIESGVTSVGKCAFAVMAGGLTSVEIPSSVAVIGRSAFWGCSSLVSVTIAYGVTQIEDAVFANCSKLTSVEIPDSVTSIGASAFNWCGGLKSVKFSENVTVIEPGTFGGCTNLTSMTIPSGVTTIADEAFYKCSGLTSVTIPKSVVSIGAYAFAECTALEVMTFTGDAPVFGEGAFAGDDITAAFPLENTTWTAEADKQEGIRFIRATGTNGSTNWTLRLNGTMEIVGSAADGTGSLSGAYTQTRNPSWYEYKDYITHVTIAEGVSGIPQWTFYYLNKVTEYEIPSTCKTIGAGAFYMNHKLTSITIPEGVTTIGIEAFRACFALRKVTLPSTVTTISKGAFYASAVGGDINLQEGLTTIGAEAFFRCSFRDLVIPATVTSIGSNAFQDNNAMKTVTFLGDAPTLGSYVFTTIYYVPTSGEMREVVGGIDSLQAVYYPAHAEGYTKTYMERAEGTSIANQSFASNSQWIAVHPMDETKPVTTIAPNCTQSGRTEFVCAICGEPASMPALAQPALGHTEVIDAAMAPTCTTAGKTEGKHCSVCNEILVAQQTVAALGHTEVIDAAVAPTCTTAGKTEGKHCSVCNEVLIAQQTVNALGHTKVIDAAVPATCTTAGKTEGKHCSVCNEILVAQQTVNALGHTEVIDAAVAATCTTAGKTEGKHCSVCGEVLVAQQTVAALGHTEVTDAAVAPTCTTAGKTEGKHCSVCGEVLVAQQTVAALGHTEVTDAAVAPTCTTAGKTEGKHCSVCNEVLIAQQTVPAIVHTTLAAPQLNAPVNAANGVSISWTAVNGVPAYRVFYRSGSGSWSRAADVTGTSYTVTGLTGGTAYSFTVRGVCPDCGKYVSAYDTAGKSITYTPAGASGLASPVISSLTNTATGVTVKWNAVSGAEKYRVFYRVSGGSWTRAVDTTATSCTVTGLTSGTVYAFTVRCINAAGTAYTSSYDTVGKGIVYRPVTTLASPVISSLTNTATGVMVKWNAVSGAEKYRVYYRVSGGSWTRAVDTTATSCTVTGLTSGTIYAFTVRCLSADGKTYTSAYDTVGKGIVYRPVTTLASPVISSLTNTATGVTVKWNAVSGAEKYRVYQKTGSGTWTKVGDTAGTNLTVTGLTSGTTYYFTVRCMNAAGTAFTSSYDSVGVSIRYVP